MGESYAMHIKYISIKLFKNTIERKQVVKM